MIHSKRSQEGYLLIDHRASPGVTEQDIAKLPANLQSEFVPTRNLFEAPTLRCCHCGTMVILNPDRKRDRHYCGHCDHYVCDRPFCVMHCNSLEKRIEGIQESAALLLNIKEV